MTFVPLTFSRLRYLLHQGRIPLDFFFRQKCRFTAFLQECLQSVPLKVNICFVLLLSPVYLSVIVPRQHTQMFRKYKNFMPSQTAVKMFNWATECKLSFLCGENKENFGFDPRTVAVTTTTPIKNSVCTALFCSSVPQMNFYTKAEAVDGNDCVPRSKGRVS